MILIGENEIRYATQLAFWTDSITRTDIFSLLLMSITLCGIFLISLRMQ